MEKNNLIKFLKKRPFLSYSIMYIEYTFLVNDNNFWFEVFNVNTSSNKCITKLLNKYYYKKTIKFMINYITFF